MWWNYLSIPKLQRCNRWSLGMDKQFHPILYNGCNHLSIQILKLNHISKRGPRCITPSSMSRMLNLEDLKVIRMQIFTGNKYKGRFNILSLVDQPIIGADNGLSPFWRQVIIRPNGGLMLIGPLRIHFSEIWIKTHKMHLKMSPAKCGPFRLGISVLKCVK